MKRICYLLVWLLTGFSIAANNSNQNFATLPVSLQAATFTEGEELKSAGSCDDFLPEITTGAKLPIKSRFIQVSTFISCAKR